MNVFKLLKLYQLLFKSSKLFQLMVAFCLTLLCGFALAQGDKPSFSASVTGVMTAKVVALDHKTRAVTLQAENGEQVSFTAGEEVRNLAQVAIGDVVVAEVMERVSIQVVAAENVEAAREEMLATARAKEGEKPGAAVVNIKVVVSKVVDINIEKNTFKLQSAEGEIKEFTARNPENLKMAAVGDVVVSTLTQAVALSVEKAAVEKASGE